MHQLAPLALALFATIAQDAPAIDPHLVVRELAARAETTELPRLWPLVQELDGRISSSKKDAEEIVAAIREELPSASSKAKLVLVRGLLKEDRHAYSDEVAAALIVVVR